LFLWIYDISTWSLCLLIVGTFTIISLAGLFLTRKWILQLSGAMQGHNEGVDIFVGTVGLFYGLIAGLMAVAVWGTYSEMQTRMSAEAGALASLYRDVDSYPEPYRSKLTGYIRDYTRYTIDVAWPEQQKGLVPTDKYVGLIESTLYSYEPKTESQKIIDASAIAGIGNYIQLRDFRLDNIAAGLPSSLWLVIIFGAIATVFLTYFLALERFEIHVIMTIFTAIMVSLLIFMIAVVDHPFRGTVSVHPDSFELIYNQLMRTK